MPHAQLSRRDRPPHRPDHDSLVRHPDGDRHRGGLLARPPRGPGGEASGRRYPAGRSVVRHRGADRRAPVRGDLQLGLLRAISREDHRRLGGGPGHSRRAHRRPDRRRVPGSPVARADLEGPGCRGPQHRDRPGDRPLGKLLQRGGLRPSDGPAVEALHLAARIGRRRSRRTSSSIPPSSTNRCGTSGSSWPSCCGCARGFATRPGALFFCYVGLYSVGRFAIESLRLDSFWLDGFRVPQLASVAGFIVAAVGFAVVSRRRAPA